MNPCRVRTRLLPTLTVLACLLPISPAYPQMRFRGKPLPECQSFWITEMGAAVGSSDVYITWEVGHMVNVSPRLALGGTAITAFDIDHGEAQAVRVGIKARARRWLSPRMSVELSPGLIVYDHRFEAEPPGLTMHVGLNYGDWIALTGQVEKAKGLPAGRFVGLKAGSYPGLIGFGLSAIFAALGILAYAAAG